MEGQSVPGGNDYFPFDRNVMEGRFDTFEQTRVSATLCVYLKVFSRFYLNKKTNLCTWCWSGGHDMDAVGPLFLYLINESVERLT